MKYRIYVEIPATMVVSARNEEEALAKARKMPLRKQLEAIEDNFNVEIGESPLVEEI